MASAPSRIVEPVKMSILLLPESATASCPETLSYAICRGSDRLNGASDVLDKFQAEFPSRLTAFSPSVMLVTSYTTIRLLLASETNRRLVALSSAKLLGALSDDCVVVAALL